MVAEVRMKIEGLDRVQRELARLTPRAIRGAIAEALNDVGFALRRAYQADIGRVFDRPTPFIKGSILVTKARADHLRATVGPTRILGKSSVDPASVLAAQAGGGRRRDKRSEVALRRAGILPEGYQTVIPADPFPGSADAYGNLKGSFVTTLLSYFRAFGEQGYRANMTDRRRRSLAKRGTTERGFKTIGGFELFVAYGSLRGGRTRHLAPGIWARRGIHGVEVKPVLMFVRRPSYQRRLDLEKMASQVNLQATFERRLRYRIRLAAGV